MGKDIIDRATLLAIAEVLKAQGKISKIDMESKSFRKMLIKESEALGKTLGNELGGWWDAAKNAF